MGNDRLPAWWGDKPDKQRQNARSAAMERRLARDTGGRTKPGSGSSWRAPGDVGNDTHLLEHKFTDKRSYRLTIEDWEQARSDAIKAGKEPGMVIEFTVAGRRLLVTEME